MTDVTTFFFDIGGVILTNGWDRNSRREGAKKFDLDWEEFEDRHALVVDDFEKGKILMDEYLRRLLDSKPAPGERRVVYPGIEEAEAEADRTANGIPYHPDVVDWFRTACEELQAPHRL